jgi:adenine deaminase
VRVEHAERLLVLRRLQAALLSCGYPHTDANYTLLFLSCDFLPDLRATQAGWIRVKTGEVLVPSERLVD